MNLGMSKENYLNDDKSQNKIILRKQQSQIKKWQFRYQYKYPKNIAKTENQNLLGYIHKLIVHIKMNIFCVIFGDPQIKNIFQKIEVERLNYLKAKNQDNLEIDLYKACQLQILLNKISPKQVILKIRKCDFQENIKKHIRLSGLIHKVKDFKRSNIDKIQYMKQKAMMKFKQKNIRCKFINKSSLTQENARLDKLNEQELKTECENKIFELLQENSVELQQKIRKIKRFIKIGLKDNLNNYQMYLEHKFIFTNRLEIVMDYTKIKNKQQ
ncbi:unnamed protein product [Paramecium sonneborni]|uniref:Uncharacterized protein n=1 Tax=Paramecium sonneborni TaxID=65129 RepID=A0A8S1JVX8_9CILI|nr:unnamed protein product [Paramecium sonneborni]